MTEIDPSRIKAGKYVLTCLRWDEITSKPGQPLDFVRHVEGDEVDLDVEQARRLVLAGAVRKPGKEDKAEVPGSGPSTAPDGSPGGVESSDGGQTKPPKIDDLLTDVGTDKAKAQAALDEENAREKPRPTLVEKLQAVIAAE